MKPSEVIDIMQKNKFIAEYIGWRYYSPKKEHENTIGADGFWLFNEGMKIKDTFFSTNAMYSLHFHDNWNWLMPVVEKIEEDYEVCIIGLECSISMTGEIAYTLICKTAETKLEATYLAVVEFITKLNNKTL